MPPTRHYSIGVGTSQIRPSANSSESGFSEQEIANLWEPTVLAIIRVIHNSDKKFDKKHPLRYN